MNTNLGASDVTTIPLYNYRIEVLRVIDAGHQK
jgi:hypothetical protein